MRFVAVVGIIAAADLARAAERERSDRRRQEA